MRQKPGFSANLYYGKRKLRILASFAAAGKVGEFAGQSCLQGKANEV